MHINVKSRLIILLQQLLIVEAQLLLSYVILELLDAVILCEEILLKLPSSIDFLDLMDLDHVIHK